MLHWDASYNGSFAESKRIKYGIPRIEKTMYLFYRSRFEEQWLNKDTSAIQHASKTIKLGMTIEKEIDYFINKQENKTVIIKSSFKFFSHEPAKEYALIKGIMKGEGLFDSYREIQINKFQKDSILNAWKINNN